MAFSSYSGLSTPNDVLEAIADYIANEGYTIIANCVDDLDIYRMSTSDGKKLVFRDRTSNYFYVLRTSNGTNIFGLKNETQMDIEPIQSGNTYGIGLTIGEGYSNIVRWYNQYRTPNVFNSEQSVGVFLPVPQYNKVGNIYTPLNYTYTLFCNNSYNGEEESDTLCFTVMKENDSYRPCAHLVLGTVEKYDTWEGGAFMSGSALYTMQESSQTCFDHDKISDLVILPVMSSGDISNTFLRINVDGAPSDERHNVYWASSGIDNLTGKKLSLPIRFGENANGNGNIPNYRVLQSAYDYDMTVNPKERIHSLDWGRNVNTLNCLSINYPLYWSVIRDPDAMSLYSAVGQSTGIYFVNTLNMQTGYVYKLNYPSFTDNCQIFSVGHRRGVYGYDGISLKQ